VSGAGPRERRVVHFRGRVQGVGFRYTTVRIAAEFAVAGYVQNLPDGRVLVVAEGRSDELDQFLDKLKAEMGSYVRDAHIATNAASGEFESFEVRY
jgi:acylphosphatase